jgi:hypothetical protein
MKNDLDRSCFRVTHPSRTSGWISRTTASVEWWQTVGMPTYGWRTAEAEIAEDFGPRADRSAEGDGSRSTWSEVLEVPLEALARGTRFQTYDRE